MKTFLLASLLCLPGLAFAQGDDEEEEVVIEKEADDEGGMRGDRKKRREERRERREKGGEGEGRGMRRHHPGGMQHPDPEARKAVKRAMELQRETRDVARILREGGEPKKKQELEKLVAELFDIRLKLTEQRVKHLKGEAERLEKQLASRKARREELIKERVDQLSGQDEGMEW